MNKTILLRDYSFEISANTLFVDAFPDLNINRMFNTLYSSLNTNVKNLAFLPKDQVDYYAISLNLFNVLSNYLRAHLKRNYAVHGVTISFLFNDTTKKATILIDMLPPGLVDSKKSSFIHPYFTTNLTRH